MTTYHYVYRSYEERGRDYIGVRSCNCLPEEDIKYFGSFRDKTFKPAGKVILFVCETREEVAEIEIELHDFFDVSVNPQFANRSKQTSTKFDTTGVPHTEEQKKARSERMSEAQKKAHSERMSGENNPCYGRTGEKNPMYGVPHTEEWKKAVSEKLSGENNPCYGRTGEKHPLHGRTGALHPSSKAIIAIKPDGTELHFGSGNEAARELGIDQSDLCGYLKTGKVSKKGKFKGWRFVYENFVEIVKL